MTVVVWHQNAKGHVCLDDNLYHWLPLFLQNLTCSNATVINGTVDCVVGLGMTPQQYNLLYAIYAWT